MRKIIGAFLIIIVGAYLGFILSRKYKKREENLNRMIEALTIIEAHIGFSADCLEEIFKTLSKSLDGDMGKMFSNICEEIKNGSLPASAFWESLVNYQQTFYFNKKDMLIIEELTKQLGRSDQAHEISYIKKTIEELLQNKKEAQAAIAKEGKLTKSFCFLSSVLLVILLM